MTERCDCCEAPAVLVLQSERGYSVLLCTEHVRDALTVPGISKTTRERLEKTLNEALS